jgi:alpha-L-fucosidase 2
LTIFDQVKFFNHLFRTLRSKKIPVMCAFLPVTMLLAIPEKATGLDWPAFLQRNDMVWHHLPDSWDNAPFIGNGNLGTIFWENRNGELNFEVSRSDLYDHRRIEGDFSVLHSQCRLPNGQFLLSFGSSKPTGDLRLDLWNAEICGHIVSGNCNWKLRGFAHAKMNLIVLDLCSGNPDVTNPPVITWNPAISQTTRALKKGSTNSLAPYPPQEKSIINGINVSVQSMPEDIRYRTDGLGVGQYTTAWTMVGLGRGHWDYFISTEISYPGTNALRQAVDTILKARSIGINGLVESHREWWHEYYPKSFLSIPDGMLESFYWIQMYKMGSCSRQNGPLIDLQGPWYMRGGWPAAWWNLNMQLTYWPFYMANHLDEAKPLQEALWKNRASLAENAAPYQADSYAIGRATGPLLQQSVGNEVGNLPWTMHNLWLYYRSSMDDHFLAEQLFPLMKGSFNYLNHIAVIQPNGRLGLPATASPEYTDKAVNCSYTLACFRWLAGAIIAADSRLKTHDPIVAKCREVLVKLVPYEVDSTTGIMVGKDIPFKVSHRHWSHLFMIYPFHEWDWDDARQRLLMEQSLTNWTANTKGFAGYSWLGAASMYASAGQGDTALKFLHTFLNKSPLPNTLYREGAPVIETPLACARTIQEMLMTSYGNCIRIFPGVPSTWTNASFAGLRAEGAFLVSAVRKNNVTQFITIKSLAGEPCLVRPNLPGTVLAKGDRHFVVTARETGMVEIDLAKGETVMLCAGKPPDDASISPVERDGITTPWGEEKAHTLVFDDSNAR